MIVVDASLAVKWFVAESDSVLARRVLGTWAGRMAAPDLIAVEVGSALVRQANSDKATAAYSSASLDKWVKLLGEPTIVLCRVSPENLRHAATLAMSLGHPLKDCLYLALAIELDCDFITCDGRFAAKAAELFPRTKMLQEFSA
jgi:predicted nucleic acid-binding protein